MSVGLIVGVVLLAAGLVVALVLLSTGARGAPRVLGLVGTVLIFVGVLSRFAYQWLVDEYLGLADNDTLVVLLAGLIAVAGVLTGAGLLVITRAVVVASRTRKA